MLNRCLLCQTSGKVHFDIACVQHQANTQGEKNAASETRVGGAMGQSITRCIERRVCVRNRINMCGMWVYRSPWQHSHRHSKHLASNTRFASSTHCTAHTSLDSQSVQKQNLQQRLFSKAKNKTKSN